MCQFWRAYLWLFGLQNRPGITDWQVGSWEDTCIDSNLDELGDVRSGSDTEIYSECDIDRREY